MATILGLPLLDEAFEEGAHGGVMVSCGHGGHEEGALEACASRPSVLRPRVISAVARMRGAAGEAGGGAPVDAAEFGHAGLEDKGGLTSNAGDRGERVEAGLEAGIGGDNSCGARLEAGDFAVQRCRARWRASGRASGRRKGAGGSDWSRPRA